MTSLWGHSNLTNDSRWFIYSSLSHPAFILFLTQVYEHVDGSKSLKLGDFGLATVVNGPLFTVCGTPTYVAPEIITETGWVRGDAANWTCVVKDGEENKTVITPKTTCSSEDKKLRFLFRHWQLWAEGRRVGSWCHHLHTAVWLSSVSQVCTVFFFLKGCPGGKFHWHIAISWGTYMLFFLKWKQTNQNYCSWIRSLHLNVSF